MSAPENPAAFPCTGEGFGNPNYSQHGMSLRDWFASQCDQPGVAEIVAMAGHKTDGFWVEFLDGSERTKFNDWYNAMPLDQRFGLVARVRYAIADAMLKERSKVQS